MSYKIILADDDLEDMELIEDAILGSEPHTELHKFATGLKALEYLNSRSDADLPSLIILDYNMPELNGAEILLSLKAQERYQSIPKVVLSTSNAPPHIDECLGNGATEYIIKPNSMKELYELAERLLAFCKGV